MPSQNILNTLAQQGLQSALFTADGILIDAYGLDDHASPGITLDILARQMLQQGGWALPTAEWDSFIHALQLLLRHQTGQLHIQHQQQGWLRLSAHPASNASLLLIEDVTANWRIHEAMTQLLDALPTHPAQQAANAIGHALGAAMVDISLRPDKNLTNILHGFYLDSRRTDQAALAKQILQQQANEQIEKIHLTSRIGTLIPITLIPDGLETLFNNQPFFGLQFAIGDSNLSAIGLARLWFTDQYEPSQAAEDFLAYLNRWIATHWQRLQAEFRLRHSEQRFRDFAALASDWFWEMDSDYRWVSLTGPPQLREYLPVENMIGHSALTPIGHSQEPHRWLSFKAQLDQRGRLNGILYPVLNRTGEQRLARLYGAPIFWGDGTLRGWRGTAQDVTDEIAARNAADTANRRQQDALEGANALIAITDPTLKLVSANQRFRQIFGHGVTDLMGTNFAELAAQAGHQDLAASLQLYQQANQDGYRFTADNRYFQASLQRTSEGGLLYLASDITELVAREKQLLEAKNIAEMATQSKSQFLAAMSHELRTPLNAILGFTELITTQIYGPLGHERYADYIADIHRSGEHLLRIITDILEVAKLDTGQMILHEERIDLAALLQATAKIVAPHADAAGVGIRVESPEQPVFLWADKVRVQQMMLNLLSNAIKFSDAGGSVLLALEPPPASSPDLPLRIRIQDWGCGMQSSDIPKALEPFTQLHSGLSRPHDGAGLGLPLTRQLIELHGGRIDLYSSPGSGTTATLYFPAQRVIRN